jgi:hypothetical protein
MMSPDSQAWVPGAAGPVRCQAGAGAHEPAMSNRAVQPTSGAGAAGASLSVFRAPLAADRLSR